MAFYFQVHYSQGRVVPDSPSTPSSPSSHLSSVPAWLGEVRAARDRHEQNTESLRDTRGVIFLRTLREVGGGEELLVWYGDEMARECGIPVLTPNNIRGEQVTK